MNLIYILKVATFLNSVLFYDHNTVVLNYFSKYSVYLDSLIMSLVFVLVSLHGD